MFSPRARRALSSTSLLLASVVFAAQTVEPARAPVAMKSPVLDKNFYLLTLLDRTPDVHALIKSDSALNKIAEQRLAAMDRAAKSCGSDLDCNILAFRWNEEQTLEAGNAL